jgi:hypothetical protein
MIATCGTSWKFDTDEVDVHDAFVTKLGTDNIIDRQTTAGSAAEVFEEDFDETYDWELDTLAMPDAIEEESYHPACRSTFLEWHTWVPQAQFVIEEELNPEVTEDVFDETTWISQLVFDADAFSYWHADETHGRRQLDDIFSDDVWTTPRWRELLPEPMSFENPFEDPMVHEFVPRKEQRNGKWPLSRLAR